MSISAVPAKFALGLNENPFAPLDSVRQAMAAALRDTNRYPEFSPQRLLALIADRMGFAADRIVVGAGATGVAMNIMQEFVATGDRIVMASPTFDGYPILTEIVGGESVRIPLTASGQHDLPAIAAAIDDRTRLVVLCTPHNPTGTCIAEAEVSDLLAAVPSRVMAIVDEAYIDFVDERDRLDIPTILDRHPNVVVLRTFSKAFGLAGLRVGYGIGCADVISQIRRRQLPFGINALAEVAVAASFQALDELAARTDLITRERDFLALELRQLGFDIPNSRANCVFISGGRTKAARICAALEQVGVVVKRYNDHGVRITVGDRSATQAVLSALRAT